MDKNEIKAGMRVKTAFDLCVDDKSLNLPDWAIHRRARNAEGSVVSVVAEHGGEVFWVQHDAPASKGSVWRRAEEEDVIKEIARSRYLKAPYKACELTPV